MIELEKHMFQMFLYHENNVKESAQCIPFKDESTETSIYIFSTLIKLVLPETPLTCPPVMMM